MITLYTLHNPPCLMLRLATILLLSIVGTTTSGLALAKVGKQDVEAEVRSSGELRVCVVSDYAGISLRDPRTGRLSGLDIEMSKRLAARLGATARYIETNFLSFLVELERRRCHIAMMGIWVSAGREQRIDFSEPYLASSAYVAVARANRRLQSWADVDTPETVVSVVNTPDLMQRAMNLLPDVTIAPLPLAVAAVRGSTAGEVMSGRADALIVDYSMASSLKRNDTWARVIAPPKKIIFTKIAYAVPQGEPRWLATVNEFVREIKSDGSLRATANQYGLAELLVPE